MHSISTKPPTRRAVIASALACGGSTVLSPAHAQQDIYRPFRGQKIVFSYPGPHPHYDAAQSIFDRFTQETGIQVERDRTPYLGMRERQLHELRKPQGEYDVVTYLISWKGEYTGGGLLRQLDAWMSGGVLSRSDYDAGDLIANYVDAIGRTHVRTAGAHAVQQLYGIPYGGETSVLGFRRDVLQDAGLGVPTTYGELLAACETIHKRGKMGGLASRTQRGHQIVHAWLLHLSPQGGHVFDAQGRPALQKPAGVRAAEILRQIVDTGPSGLADAGFAEMQEAFISGASAFYLDSQTVMGVAEDPRRSRVAGKVGYAMHPIGREWSGSTGGFGLGIPANARHPEAAFLFIQWLTSKANDLQVALAGGTPGRWSTFKNPEFRARWPQQSILPYALRAANPAWRPLIPEWDAMARDVVGQALPDVLSGRRTAEAALSACVAPLEAMRAPSDTRIPVRLQRT